MRASPVILDVDTGVDDALAVMLAVGHPALEVRGITCVAGNVDVTQVVRNTLAVLTLVDAPAIPVAAGAARPLIAAPQPAVHVHGDDGLGGATLPSLDRSSSELGAVELIHAILSSADAPVTIIATAPLTNVALLLRSHPEDIAKIERIVWMGGAIGAGNATASAEFNAWHDPEAAAIVLASGAAVTMYGLEPFYRVGVPASTIDELAPSSEPRARAVGELLRCSQRMGVGETRLSAPGCATIGDAGAVAAAIDPRLVTMLRAPVAVELAGEITRGRTVVDLRSAAIDLAADPQTTTESHVDVVTDVDADGVLDLFLSTVLGPVQVATDATDPGAHARHGQPTSTSRNQEDR